MNFALPFYFLISTFIVFIVIFFLLHTFLPNKFPRSRFLFIFTRDACGRPRWSFGGVSLFFFFVVTNVNYPVSRGTTWSLWSTRSWNQSGKGTYIAINLLQKLPSPLDCTKSMLDSCPSHHFSTSPAEWEFKLANLADIFHGEPSRSPANLAKERNSHKFAFPSSPGNDRWVVI